MRTGRAELGHRSARQEGGRGRGRSRRPGSPGTSSGQGLCPTRHLLPAPALPKGAPLSSPRTPACFDPPTPCRSAWQTASPCSPKTALAAARPSDQDNSAAPTSSRPKAGGLDLETANSSGSPTAASAAPTDCRPPQEGACVLVTYCVPDTGQHELASALPSLPCFSQRAPARAITPYPRAQTTRPWPRVPSWHPAQHQDLNALYEILCRPQVSAGRARGPPSPLPGWLWAEPLTFGTHEAPVPARQVHRT